MIYTASEVQRWLLQLGLDETTALPTRRRDLIVQQPYAAGGGVWRVSRTAGGYRIDTINAEWEARAPV